MTRIAVDIGGTFTDCVVYVGPGRKLVIAKSPTDHGDLAQGVLDAVAAAATSIGISLPELLRGTEQFIHGSTIATNTMIARDGARTAFVTTRGHEDTLAIGRVFQKVAGISERDRVHMAQLDLADPELVPRELVVGVNERVDYKGAVVVELSDEEIGRTVRWVREREVEAVAVCLLWSFLSPAHEQRIAAALRAELPGVFVSTSVDLAPVLGEYERGVTTALNAYLSPPIERYLNRLEGLLRDGGLTGAVLVMTAEGGVMPIARAASQAIKLLDSGPVGGTLGSRFLGRAYGEDNVICTDVGGTSFDVSLISGGELEFDRAPVIDQYVFCVPKVAVKSIGAGGGSIAWVDELGVLKVGPHSAQADPGPACYGRGGTEPTVTDANLLLGYLDPDTFLGGEMQLDVRAAERAFEPVAQRLGQPVIEVAAGVHRILDARMADLLRGVTIERGHDPRDYVLFAYGGAAAAHATGYAAEAGAKAIYALADATAFSAVGMLTADLVHTFERTRPVRSPFSDEDASTVSTVLQELEAEAAAQIAEETGGELPRVTFRHTLLMRFQAQVHELEIDSTTGAEVTKAQLEALIETFTRTYEGVYGEHSAFPEAGVEVMTFRVTATVPTFLEDLPNDPAGSEDASGAITETRKAFFHGHGLVGTTVYDGSQLTNGNRLTGPALVQRYGDTVLVPPGFSADVDRYGNLAIVSLAASGAPAASGAVGAAELDAITYEVIRNRLWAINDEQAMTAAMTSGSTFIYEAYDFNSGITDGEGNGVFAGTYILFHTTALDMAVHAVRETFDEINDGDMYVLNDPWCGAIHYNDVVTVTPIVVDDEVVAWGAVVMHDPDVGGPVPGSFCVGSTNVYEEPPLVPPIKLMDRGRYCREIEAMFLRNSRTPMLNALNFRARVASQSVTRRRIKEVIARYGKERFKATIARVQDEAEGRLRSRLRELPDGEWFDHVYLDHDGLSKENLYEVCVRLHKYGDRLTFDFAGSAEQARSMLNGTQSALRGGVMTAVLVTLCHDIPWATGGLTRVVEVLAEPGSVINATYPAGVSGASIGAEEAVENVAQVVLAKMLASSETYRDEAMGVWYPLANVPIHAGIDQYGGVFANLLFDMAAGGGGARSFKDGIDCGGYFECVSATCSNVEANERVFPLLQLYRRRRSETYGHGMYRGGTGVEYAVIPHDAPCDVEVTVAGHGAGQPQAPGVYGGYPCANNGNLLLRDADVRAQFERGAIPMSAEGVASRAIEVLESKDRATLGLGDMHVMWVAGGSGYGDPILRDPEHVARDVRAGLCSERDAAEIYAVALCNGRIDAEETERRRAQLTARRLRQSRPVAELIERYGTVGAGRP